LSQECCRLPPTYFWATWHQSRAFLTSVKKKRRSFWVVWQLRKMWYVWELWALPGVDPMPQSTGYLLLDHLAPN
jgi:hypothetical protein